MYPKLLFLFLLLPAVTMAQADSLKQPSREDSLVGSLTPEKAWWNLIQYSIRIKPDHDTRTLVGSNTIRFKVTTDKHPGSMQIDLVKPLVIDRVDWNGRNVQFKNEGNIWYLALGNIPKGNTESITIYYSGKPVESKSPPWDGGLVWAQDSLKRPWISVACQYKGASLWFPCKNMLYDEPDSGAVITISSPAGMTAISNGRLRKQQQNANGTVDYTWAVTNPINHYGISFYIGSYTNISRAYDGRKGRLSMDFWVLDYNREKALSHMIPEVQQAMRSMENWFGPYPFYEDGFKMVDAPYIGMEHQSAIAYGNNYTKGTYKGNDVSGTGWGKKTDRIIVHEMAHEWFGNSITALDKADLWIQEGFTGLAEELVIEDQWGKQAGEAFTAGRYRSIENVKPVIGRYGINEDGNSDGYIKGWAVLQMVKTIMNDDQKFRRLLGDLNARFYHQVVSSKQVEEFIIEKTGFNYQPFFDQYLRTAQVPVLEYKLDKGLLTFRFTNCNDHFSIPVRISHPKPIWITPTTRWQSVPMEMGDSEVIIDPVFYLKSKAVSSSL